MNTIPSFPINPADLLLVNDLLGPYAETVKRTTFESQERSAFLQRIDNLSKRIGAIGNLPPGAAIPIILTPSDIMIILSALELFITTIPLMGLADDIKQTTLQSASRLYLSMKKTFSP